ncbi:DUF4136 domain-containing protein [Stakelama saccharophila]|uniref:DUF4136 domain-containing protein n=1 Tax=Stakelama saccharophila TaxID=3075605 RepID=A0ABZ0BBD4_9SPHN|nr:DUF4136 domain-containing protein [Stakelama sp. W311]WNO54597.1 DUF4136 domain-containing protein [Stakelama sp. W311]
MRIRMIAALAALALSTAGCAAGTGMAPVDVTRYHLDPPIPRDGFAVEPLKTGDTISPEYESYAQAVRRELSALGFTQQTDGASEYIAAMSFTRAPLGVIEKRSPFRIGLGGGSFGGDVGVGGGASVGIGGGTRQVIGTELAVQLRRRSDNTTVWEGRAVTRSILGDEDAQPQMVADKLASALFKGFPGESGITITVE